MQNVVYAHWATTAAPTGTEEKEVETTAAGLGTALETLRSIDRDLDALEVKAEALDAPWTPGRIPKLW